MKNMSNEHKDIILHRYHRAITNYNLIVYLINPKYLGEHLSQTENYTIFEWLIGENEVIHILIYFKLIQGILSEKYLFLKETIENVAGFNWWRLINISDNIKSYIRGLLRDVCSSTGVERIISSYGRVQSKLRNRLGNEKPPNLYFYFVN